jgi:hypothetical protein
MLIEMAKNELANYVDEKRRAGFSDDAIKTILQNSGFPAEGIAEAFRVAGGVQAKTAPTQPAAPAEQSAQVPAAQADSVQRVQTVLRANQEAPTQPAPRPRRTNLAAVVAIVGLLIVGGSASAYYAYQKFTAPAPAQVIGAMIQNSLTKLASADTTQSASVIVNYGHESSAATGTENPYASLFLGSGSSTFSVSINASGSFDVSDKTNRKFDEKMLITLGGMAENMTMTVGLEVRMIGSKLYAELTNVPNLGFFDPTPIEDKWIEVDAASSTPGLTVNNPFASATLSQADITSIMEALKEAFQVSKALPDESIDGVPAYHYEYALDKQGLKDFIHAVMNIMPATTTSRLAEAGADGFVDALQDGGGDLVIGKGDLFPREFSIDFSFATTTYGYSVNTQFSATSTYANINAPHDIEAPAGAESLDQALNDVAAGAYSSGKPVASDGQRLADLREVQEALELYFAACGYYPGGIVVSGRCAKFPAKISTWSALADSLTESNLGVSAVPNDPLAGATYYYGTNGDNSRYVIAAKMDGATSTAFQSYLPPSLTGLRASGLASCAKPYYCLTP